jgi:archaellum component FlaF (FlaF/FlaG flagellin family)
LDKTIITALLIIAGVVSAVVLYNAVYPAIIQSGDALTGRQRRIDERINSQIEIIHAVPWGVCNVDTVYVWVKNIGSSRIAAVENCDVFFGPEGNFSRISYGTGDSRWTYQVENGTEWNPTATLKITIEYVNQLGDERYFVKVVLPNGVSDEYYFSFDEQCS